MSAREVVVTGIGVVSPVGVGRDNAWSALVAGKSGIGPLTRLGDLSRLGEFPITVAGEVDDFASDGVIPPAIDRKIAQFARFGVVAAALALTDAGLSADSLDPERTGTVVGTCYGGLTELAGANQGFVERGWRAVGPAVGPATMANAAIAAITMVWGLHGPAECVATSCATGAQAISRAADLVRHGHADVVLAGGCDAPLTPVAISAFATARALSRRDGDPREASRPFEADRKGFVLAEGSALLVLESAESARARGVRPLARFLGWGHSADAHNLAQPPGDGAGAVRAMRAALRMAGCSPSDVDYVHAHATGTQTGDLAEARALHTVFHGDPPPVSATKSMTGHMVGAAGSMGAAVAVLSLADGILPPTINHDAPDPECALDVVPNVARKADPRVALSNAFALGGINCSLAFGRI